MPTVDDFGKMGQSVSHVELLNSLSHSFVEKGWSTKQLISEMVHSYTYQQSSRIADCDSKALEMDPDNVLLSRMNIRRLTAESIRDSILKTTGDFDPQLYGSSILINLSAQMQGRGRPRSGPVDGKSEAKCLCIYSQKFLACNDVNFLITHLHLVPWVGEMFLMFQHNLLLC